MTQRIEKLLFVTDAPHCGGAERYIAAMATAALRRGMAPSVCWIKPAESADAFAGVLEQGIGVTVLPAASVQSLPAFWRAMERVFKSERPDAAIVNACGRARMWASTWASRLHGVPAVWVHHMVDQQDYRRLEPSRLGGRVEGLHVWRFKQLLRHRLASAGATAVIALNEQDRRQIAREQALGPSRISVVPNGIDTERYRFDVNVRDRVRAEWLSRASASYTTGPFIIGVAGRLIGGKGIEEAIQATALLRAQNVPVLTAIAGDGPLRADLQSLAEQLGIVDSVLFLGFVEDMPAFYNGLDAFVLASRTESFGLVLAEALSCARAVVATPTAGACSQIIDGVSGRLCTGFSCNELAEILQTLHADSAAREQIGRRGRQRVLGAFSIDRALEQTLQVLQSGKMAVRHSELTLAAGGAA